MCVTRNGHGELTLTGVTYITMLAWERNVNDVTAPNYLVNHDGKKLRGGSGEKLRKIKK